MEKLLSIEDVQAGLRDYVPDLDSRMDERVRLVVDYLTECFVCAYNHMVEKEMDNFLKIPVDAEMAEVIMHGIGVCFSEGLGNEEGEERLIRVLNAVYPEVVAKYTYIDIVKKIAKEGKCVTP